MDRRGKTWKLILFTLYFLFLWTGQIASARAAGSAVFFNFWIFVMYLCIFSRAAVWFLILRDMDLIKAYSLSSVNFIIIPILSRLFLGEALEVKYLMGALLIIPGIMLFALGEKQNRAVYGEAAEA